MKHKSKTKSALSAYTAHQLEPNLCCGCGRNMVPSGGRKLMAFKIWLDQDNGVEWDEVYPELPRDIDFELCYVCLLERLGWKNAKRS